VVLFSLFLSSDSEEEKGRRKHVTYSHKQKKEGRALPQSAAGLRGDEKKRTQGGASSSSPTVQGKGKGRNRLVPAV